MKIAQEIKNQDDEVVQTAVFVSLMAARTLGEDEGGE